MPFEVFPYTNFHELNLDTILDYVSEIKDKAENIDASVANAEESANTAEELKNETLLLKNETADIYNRTSNLLLDINQQVNTNTNNINVQTSRIDEIIAGSSVDPNAELIDIRVGADGEIYETAGDAVRGQIQNIEDIFIKEYSKVNIIQNIYNDKYVSGNVGGHLTITDAANNSYASGPVIPGEHYSAVQPWSDNFSYWTDNDDIVILKGMSNARDAAYPNYYVYTAPAGATKLYIGNINNNQQKAVIVNTTESMINKTTSDYPVGASAVLESTKIPTLIAGSNNINLDTFVDEAQPPYYSNIRDFFTNIIDIYHPATAQGTYVINNDIVTWEASTQYSSLQYEFNSNTKVSFNISGNNTRSGSLNVVLQYKDSNGTWHNAENGVTLGAIFNVTTELDCPSLTVYQGAVLFRILIILNSAGNNIATFTNIDVHEFTSIQNLEIYDDNFLGMITNIQDAIDDAKNTAITTEPKAVSPNGTAYIISVDNNGHIITIPVLPEKTLFCGNSLLLGMNTTASNHQYVYGMCASAPENDYCHKTMDAIIALNSNATYDRVHGAAIEQLGTSDSFNDLWNNTNNVYTNEPLKNSFTSDLDLIVIQLGDNVNSDDRITAFSNNIETFLSDVRSSSPRARIIWMYGWFNNVTVANIIENACKKWNIPTINISSLNTVSNQGYSGQSYITGTGSTGIVSDNWITHPGDTGMTAIANRLIEVIGI